MHTSIHGGIRSCIALALIAGLFVPGAAQQESMAQAADYRHADGDPYEATRVDAADASSSTALTPADSLTARTATGHMETHRARYLAHFMGWKDPSQGVPLLYASPKAFDWPFERGLDDVRSAEALLRNWTRYRDDDVVVEMDPLSTSVRIVLPLNRTIREYER